MPYFIKTGLWEKASKGFKGWLNLDDIIKTSTIVPLTDAATMDLSASRQTLTSAAAVRTFTISYTGDDITLEVTLNAVAATYTFPSTALCVSEGVASGDNTLS